MEERIIYKYTLGMEAKQEIEMPKNAKVLCVQAQFEKIQIWAMIDLKEKETELREFRIYGTGHKTRQFDGYIGTFQLEAGNYVFHLFEHKEKYEG